MFIRTERLFLRPGWPEDVDELLHVLGDGSLVRSIGVAAMPPSARALREYLSRPRDRLLPHFFINLRDDAGPKLIGGIGLGRAGRDVELTYWLARRHSGSGYAAEAVKAVLAEARMLGHRKVVATPVPDNDVAVQVLQNSGFKPTDVAGPRSSRARGADSQTRLYVAVLADRLFDLLGVGPQRMANLG